MCNSISKILPALDETGEGISGQRMNLAKDALPQKAVQPETQCNGENECILIRETQSAGALGRFIVQEMSVLLPDTSLVS